MNIAFTDSPARFLLLLMLPLASVRAEVVATIDEGGDTDVASELGSLSLADMQDLINATDDLELAGVLDAEGTFGAGDFSQDEGALAQKLVGTGRYGRADGVAQKASGTRWGFVNGEETWTPGPGLSYFGLITTPAGNANLLTVTVTYSDATTETVTASDPGVTTWIGFHKPGETITAMVVSDPAGGAFGNWDDISLAFVESAGPERPEMTIRETAAQSFELTFTGVLQESQDLETWTDVDPAPTSPVEISAAGPKRFYRARAAE